MKEYYSRDKDSDYRQQCQAKRNPPQPEQERKLAKKRFPWGKLVIVLVIVLIIFIRYLYIMKSADEKQEMPRRTEVPVQTESIQAESE